jgi:sulfite exporter TauE/SafE
VSKYEAEVARLIALKVTLDVEEGRMKWLPVLGLVAGLGVAAFVKPVYGFLPFALGIVMFGTGLYLTRVHKMERDYNLDRAKKELSRLKAEEKAAVTTAPVASVEGEPAGPSSTSST